MLDITLHGGIFGGGGGGKSDFNIYTQLTEPSEKEGIWFKTNHKNRRVISDTDIFTGNTIIEEYSDMGSRSTYMTCSDEQYMYIIKISAENTGENGYTHEFLRYDPINNTYTALARARLNNNRVNGAFLYHEGKIYWMLGGMNVNTFTTSADMYDIATNTWTTLANGSGRYGSDQLSAVGYGNKIYIYGGNVASGTTIAPTRSALIYNIESNTWQNTASILPENPSIYHALRVGTNAYLANSINDVDSYLYKVNLETSPLIVNRTDILLPPFSGNFAFCLVNVSGTLYLISQTSIFKNVGNSFVKVNENSLTNNRKMRFGYFLNGHIFMHMKYPSGNLNSSIARFNLTSKQYEEGTTILIRSHDRIGRFYTELVSPKTRIANFPRLETGFDFAWLFAGGDMRIDIEVYYGNGSSWVKFRN